MKPIHGKIILKLETASIRKTIGGIFYDTAFEHKSYAYGHVYIIDEEKSKEHDLKVGDRVIFEKDKVETLTYKSKETNRIIDVVLVFIHPNDVMAKVAEDRTVLDYLK